MRTPKETFRRPYFGNPTHLKAQRTISWEWVLRTALLVLHVTASSANEPEKFTLLDDGDRQLLSIAFSPSGKFMAVSSGNHTIKIWDLNSLQKIRTFEDKTVLAACISFSDDDKTLCLGTRDGTIATWDIASENPTLKHNFPGLVWYSIHPLPNGKWLAAATNGTSVFLWNSEVGKETQEFVGHEFDVQDVVFSSDGKSMVSGDFRGYVRIWEWNTGVGKASAASIAGSISKIAVSPSRDLVMIGDCSCELSECTLPNLSSSRLRSYGDEVESINHLVISPDGKYSAVGIQDIGKIELWNIRERKIAAELSSKQLSAVAFTVDGQSIASTSVDGVKLWKMQEIIHSERKP